MNLTMGNLKECFTSAINSNAKFIGIAFNTLGAGTTFVKIIPRINFVNYKMHIDMFYNNDLMHKHYIKRITGFTFGDSFAEIEKDLLEQSEI